MSIKLPEKFFSQNTSPEAQIIEKVSNIIQFLDTSDPTTKTEITNFIIKIWKNKNYLNFIKICIERFDLINLYHHGHVGHVTYESDLENEIKNFLNQDILPNLENESLICDNLCHVLELGFDDLDVEKVIITAFKEWSTFGFARFLNLADENVEEIDIWLWLGELVYLYVLFNA